MKVNRAHLPRDRTARLGLPLPFAVFAACLDRALADLSADFRAGFFAVDFFAALVVVVLVVLAVALLAPRFAVFRTALRLRRGGRAAKGATGSGSDTKPSAANGM